MVRSMSFGRGLSDIATVADVEAEDVELGDAQRADEALASDVDGDVDADALESDDDDEANDELGIESEETDGGC